MAHTEQRNETTRTVRSLAIGAAIFAVGCNGFSASARKECNSACRAAGYSDWSWENGQCYCAESLFVIERGAAGNCK